MTAYVALGDDPAWEARLRDLLEEQLPKYMIPAAFVRLAALPRLANGKLDRHGLPAPSSVRRGDQPQLAPRTETEAGVAQIWKEVLELDGIGVNDNFFHLGGHSLMAARVLSRLARTFDVRLPLSDFFRRPTVAGVARYVDQAGGIGSLGHQAPGAAGQVRQRISPRGACIPAIRRLDLTKNLSLWSAEHFHPGLLELRAAFSLSRLWSRSRRDEARRLLGGVLQTFSEGHDTADLRQASEQMARLARAPI